MFALPIVLLLVVHFILFFFLKKSEKLYALITPRNVIIFFIFTLSLNIIPNFLLPIVPIYGALISFVSWALVVGLLVGIIYKIFKKSFKTNFIEGFFTGTLAIFVILVFRLINYS